MQRTCSRTHWRMSVGGPLYNSDVVLYLISIFLAVILVILYCFYFTLSYPLPYPSSDCSARTVEAKIQVLTVGYWPTYPAVAFSLPPVLQASQDHFAAFYTEKYQGE